MTFHTKPSPYIYAHGMPFSEDLATEVLQPLYITRRLARAILIDGIPGTGKTTMAVHITEYLQGFPVDFDNGCIQLAMGGLQLMEKGELCSKKGLKIVIYDEAADLNKRGAISKFNRELIGFFNKYRAYNILLIIVLPVFWHLDTDLFDLGIIQGLVHLYDAQDNHTSFGVYDYSGMGYLRMWADKFQYNKRMTYVRQRPYFVGHFLPLPPERQQQLDAISLEQKQQSVKAGRKRMKKMQGE